MNSLTYKHGYSLGCLIRLWLFITGCFFFTHNILATSIQVNDTIRTNTTWDVDTIFLTDTAVFYPLGTYLTIVPGTRVLAGENAKLIIWGSLTAVGAEDDSIYFTAIDTSRRWSGVDIRHDESSSSLSHCHFSYSDGGHIGGGGLWVSSNIDITISDCSFAHNVSSEGGGLKILSAKAILQNSHFMNNHAEFGGGALCLVAESMVRDNWFLNNSTDGVGGAIYVYGVNNDLTVPTNLTIQNNRFSENESVGDGGAVYFNNSPAWFIGNLVVQNTAMSGGGIAGDDFARPYLILCTIADNHALGRGGGVFADNNSGLRIWSSVITPNLADTEGPNLFDLNQSDIMVDKSLVEGAEDLYLNSSTGDYSLHYNNFAAIEGGMADTTGFRVPALDIEGNPRIYGANIDMGAFEYQGVAGTNLKGRQVSESQMQVKQISNYLEIRVRNLSITSAVLKVYNIRGEIVKTLKSSEEATGIFIWNRKNEQQNKVPAGLYGFKYGSFTQWYALRHSHLK